MSTIRTVAGLPTDAATEVRQAEALLKTGALQSAIFNSANFSSIATDANGVIQIFNVGAERMLGYGAAEMVNKITPADISDPQELIARARALSLELGTAITPASKPWCSRPRAGSKTSTREADAVSRLPGRGCGPTGPTVIGATGDT